MRVHVISWDGPVMGNLMVATCPDLANAAAAVAIAKQETSLVVDKPTDLELSGPKLAVLFNKLLDLAVEGDNSANHVTRFATREAGQRRVFGLLDQYFTTVAEVAAPPPDVTTAATNETETTTNEDDMATTKGKTKKKAAPAAKKPKSAKKDGAKALVREDSSRGKLLKLAVENPGISLASIASRAGVSGEGSMDAKGRARMRLKKVAENVGATVKFDGDKVESFKLPAGQTLDKIFGR